MEAALALQVNSLLRQYNITPRPVYKRTITETGGDVLIGRYGSVTHVDVLLDPQPIVVKAAFGVVRSGKVIAEEIAYTASKGVADDYHMIVSSSAVNKQDLSSPSVQFVFKDLDTGALEILRVLDFNQVSYQGSTVMWDVFVRSVTRA